VHVADVGLERGTFVHVSLETQTGADVRRVLGDLVLTGQGQLVALVTGAYQDEWTERLTREQVQAVNAQGLLLVAVAIVFRTGVGAAHLHVPVFVDCLTELQATTRAATVYAEVVVRFDAVDARLDIPRRVDDRLLSHGGERRTQCCCGEGDFLSFIQGKLPINEGCFDVSLSAVFCSPLLGTNFMQNSQFIQYATAQKIVLYQIQHRL